MPFGTTVYALIHQDEALVNQTMESLRKSPFNKVRLCVFPKSYQYNQNEPPFYAFEKRKDGSWDPSRPCEDFWNHLDRRIEELASIGIEADLILFHPYDRWGFSSMPQKDNLAYLDYAVRRLAAHPNLWWSLANEYDLCLAHKSLADWEEIEGFVAKSDPFRHMLSCHNCFQPWDYSRPTVTHVSIQTKRLADVPSLRCRYGKPVVVDECCYEGNLPEFWGSISGQEMTARFWQVFVDGGYCTHGETFLDEHDVVWWAKGGILKGESPSRIAFLREIAESLPGPVELMEGNWTRMIKASQEELERMEDDPAFPKVFVEALKLMPEIDRRIHAALEHEPAGCVGDEVFLWYYGARPVARARLALPEAADYRVTLIDTWGMTRELLPGTFRGATEIAMPGRPWMAVLAEKHEVGENR